MTAGGVGLVSGDDPRGTVEGGLQNIRRSLGNNNREM